MEVIAVITLVFFATILFEICLAQISNVTNSEPIDKKSKCENWPFSGRFDTSELNDDLKNYWKVEMPKAEDGGKVRVCTYFIRKKR